MTVREIVIPSRVIEKQCVFCMHFVFSPGLEGYIEEGPCPYPLTIKCGVMNWNARDACNLDDFRRMLRKAHQCSDWLPVNLDELFTTPKESNVSRERKMKFISDKEEAKLSFIHYYLSELLDRMGDEEEMRVIVDEGEEKNFLHALELARELLTGVVESRAT